MLKNVLYPLLFVLIFVGCDSKTEETTYAPSQDASQNKPIVTQPTAFLEEASETVVVETPSEALPVWSKHSLSKPILLLMAKNPLLQTIPAEMSEQVKTLVRTGEVVDFRQKALATVASPVMLPNMALSAALDAELFSRVVWVLPALPGSEVTLDVFRNQLLNLNDITPAEAESFHAEENTFVGVIRGVPFTVVLKSSLPLLTEPVVLHLDLGFLAADYQNEIRTPLYKHADELLAELKMYSIKVHAVTLCASNLTREVSLRTRFLVSHLRSLIADPTQLGKELSGNAKLRNEALYLGNFFKKEEVLAIHRNMVANDPDDASAIYDLYQSLRQFNEIDAALESLERAVSKDLIYAEEYLELADVALSKNRPDGALRMLQKASDYFPENPFLQISQADILIRMGHTEQPKQILEQLVKLPWSNTYHKHMPTYLEEMLAAAEENTNLDLKSKAED